jgi:hypothetical protein
VPKGSNRGPQVNAYLAAVGLNPGYSWCMALLYWCMNEGCKALGVPNMMAKTGGVLDQWNKRKAKFGVNSPRPGDIFIMDFGEGLGHTGIVERVDDLLIYTIEGNSNDEGSREGYEVCRRTRLRSKIKGYLRFQ